MLTRHFAWLAFALLFTAASLTVSCGDDETGTTTGNDQGAPDLVRDNGRDLPADDPDAGDEPDGSGVPDVVADVDAEEPLPTFEVDCEDGDDNDGDELVDCDDVDDCLCEICNDLLDNDADGLVDCADQDCSDDDNCPERCQNEVDDDADDDVDCADSECASTGRCTDEPMPAETYVFEPMGYFNRLQYPPAGVPCCFNFNDDPALDNRLVAILALIPGYLPQPNMDGVVNNGSIAVLLEWREFPDDFSAGGPVDFNVFRGVPISPASTGPETNAWADGDGVFRVTADSFDDLGPRVRFEDNLLGTDGVLTGGPHFLDLTIPIPELGLDLTLTVFQARVEMILTEVEDDEPHLETVSQLATGSEGSVLVGGGKLGGYVRADDLLAFFNEGADACDCAAPVSDPGPLFAFGEQPAPTSAYVVSCNWTPLAPEDTAFTCTEADSAICPVLSQMCPLVPALPFLLDVDANKNQIDESVSVGLFFDLTGASLDADPIEGE